MNDSDTSADALPEPPVPRQQIIHAEAGSSVYVVLHGDMHIRNGYPVYQVLPYPLEARHVSVEKARQQPSRLLAAESRVVAFTGREQELAKLAAWRDDPTLGLSVMLVHAPGGQGKTRLAARFAADSAAQGWTAWAAHHLSDPTAQHVVAPGDPGQALVLIVDYADRWPVDDLLLLLQNPLLRRPQRSRVLLVARSAGPWWPSLRHRLGKADIEVVGSMHLPPLAETIPERRQAFTTARDAFAATFGIPAEQVPASEPLEGDAFQQVLTVHMAALVAVDAHRRGVTPPIDPVGLSAYLLDREHDFWHALHDHEQVATEPQAMARTVYTATLTHPLRRDHAVAALDRVGIATPDAADRVLDDHAVCYPPTNLDASTVLEPLYPDRLGEDFLALLTPGHANANYPPDEWATTAVSRLFPAEAGKQGHAPEEDAPPPAPIYTRVALTILIEAARRWPHLATGHLYPILREQPWLALGAGGAALASLATIPNLDIGVLEAIEPVLPRHQDADLDPGSAAVTERLTPHRLARTNDPATRARLHATLGWRLTRVGHDEPALAATQHALEAYRRLATADPAAFEPDVAMTLCNLGMMFSKLGRHKEAAATTEEAVEVYRRLTTVDPTTYLPELAQALYDLSLSFSKLGRREDAVAAAKEANGAYRRIATTNLAAFTPTAFWRTLHNWPNVASRIFWKLGHREKALDIAQDAVAAYRSMAKDVPAAYQPHLATALNNLGEMLSEPRPELALAPSQEAVEIYRRLAKANPGAFEPTLAAALHDLSLVLSKLGRPEAALVPLEEAVEAYRRLADASPAAFEPALAATLTNLGAVLTKLSKPEAASAVLEEAVEVHQRSAAAGLAPHLPVLAAALYDLSLNLSELGRREEALTAAVQAHEAYRRLATADPAAFAPDLAKALTSIYARLSESGRREEAAAVAAEVVKLNRELTEASPTEFEPSLATALHNLGNALAELGQWEPARAVIEEAVRIHRRSATAHPATSQPNLAGALVDLGRALAKLGRGEPALAAIAEGTDLYRRLAAGDPATANPLLAASLWNLGLALSQLGRHGEALAPIKQAADIYQELAEVNPDAHLPDCANTLNRLGLTLQKVGRAGEAIDVHWQAVLAYREAHDPQNEAVALNNLGTSLVELDQFDKAREAFQSAAGIFVGMDDPRSVATLINLSLALVRVSRFEEAADVLDGVGHEEAAAEIRRTMGQQPS